MTAIRRCAVGICRNRPCRTAIPATRAQRSASGRYQGSPSSPISLKENGTVMIRPSNSGTATCVATSSGDIPSSLAAQLSRDEVRHKPCRIGTSRRASCSMFQLSSSPPADAVAGVAPPAARTVTTSASATASCASRSSGAVRSDAQKMGRARPPLSSMASHRAWMYAVFPARC